MGRKKKGKKPTELAREFINSIISNPTDVLYPELSQDGSKTKMTIPDKLLNILMYHFFIYNKNHNKYKSFQIKKKKFLQESIQNDDEKTQIEHTENKINQILGELIQTNDSFDNIREAFCGDKKVIDQNENITIIPEDYSNRQKWLLLRSLLDRKLTLLRKKISLFFGKKNFMNDGMTPNNLLNPFEQSYIAASTEFDNSDLNKTILKEDLDNSDSIVGDDNKFDNDEHNSDKIEIFHDLDEVDKHHRIDKKKYKLEAGDEFEDEIEEKLTKRLKSDIDDMFFSFDEMNKFADEKINLGGKIVRDVKSRSNDEIESSDNDSENFVGYDKKQSLVDIIENESSVDPHNIRYEDFFDPVSSKKDRSKKKNVTQTKSDAIHSGSKDILDSEEMDLIKRLDAYEKKTTADSDSYSNFNSGDECEEDEYRNEDDDLCEHDNDQYNDGKNLINDEKKIVEFEKEVLKKPWSMMGEVRAKERPKNSLLDIDLHIEPSNRRGQQSEYFSSLDIENFDDTQNTDEKKLNSTTNSGPLTSKIELLILNRIKNLNFDDVIHQNKIDFNLKSDSTSNPLTGFPSSYKNSKEQSKENETDEIDDEDKFKKSEVGLAELYAEKYEEVFLGKTSQKTSKEDSTKSELIELFAKIMYKLDNLTNQNFIPLRTNDLSAGEISLYDDTLGDRKTKKITSFQSGSIVKEEPIPLSISYINSMFENGSSDPSSFKLHEKQKDEFTSNEKRSLRSKHKLVRKKKFLNLLKMGVVSEKQLADRRDHLIQKNKLRKLRVTENDQRPESKNQYSTKKKINTTQLLVDAQKKKAFKKNSS